MTESKTVRSLASEMLGFLNKAYATDLWDCAFLRNDAPEWMGKLWAEVGVNRRIPESFRSLFVKYALDALSQTDDFAKAWDSLPKEDAEYPFTLTKWLHSKHHKRIPMVDRAREIHPDYGLKDLMRIAYLEEQGDVFNRVLVRLVEIAKS
jgi:hypothetical protein